MAGYGGDDTIYGGEGNDLLNGGFGRTIHANTTMAGDQAFTWNSTTPGANALWWSVTDNGDGTSEVTYYGDVNGDSVADFQLDVHQIGSVTVGTDVLL